MPIDRAVADKAVVRIDFLHELLAVIDAPRAGREDLQQLEFHCSEAEILAVQRGTIPMLIQNESFRLNRLSVPGPAKHRLGEPAYHITITALLLIS